MLGSQHPLLHSWVVTLPGKSSLYLHTPETDPGVNGNRIDGMPLYSYPPHLLTPQHAIRGFFFDAYLSPPTPNLLPIYASIRAFCPSCQNVHAWKRLTLINTYEATLPLGQNDLLLAHICGLHLSYAFFLVNQSPAKILQSHFQRNFLSASQISFSRKPRWNYSYIGDSHKWRQLCIPNFYLMDPAQNWAYNLFVWWV